jgi:hypothetical protein
VFSDRLIKAEKFSKKNIRKFFNTLGFFVPTLTLVGLMFITPATRAIGFTLIFINITFSGLMYGAGYMVTFNDISGIYAGIVYGVANTIGLTTAVLAPFLVGIITTNVSPLLSILARKMKHFHYFSNFYRERHLNGILCL